jgi:hypothetical protein
MKQKTLLLFQLFLGIFAFYTVVKYSGFQQLILPLLSLAAMFLVGKVEFTLTRRDQKKNGEQPETIEKDEEKPTFQPLECLLKSKNVLLLTDAIHHLLTDLGLAVSRSPEQIEIDRLVRAPEDEATFGIKILGDIDELTEDWNKWEDLAHFDLGKDGERRLVLIGSNSTMVEEDAKPKFHDFSEQAQKFLSSKQIVAMTTLTIYKIYMLCKKKNVDPKAILKLIRRHPGGVFRLEKYMKAPSEAA